jgi:hypothetical protein
MRFFAYLSLFALRTLSDAWAVWVLWGWFVRPLGAPHLGYVNAMGLDLLFGTMLALAMPRRQGEADDNADLLHTAGKLLIAPIAVGFGWLIQGAL